MIWLKNSHGHRDAMLTFAAVTLGSVLFKVLAAGVVVNGTQLGTMPDASVIGALLVPTLGAYVARRNHIAARGEEQPKP